MKKIFVFFCLFLMLFSGIIIAFGETKQTGKPLEVQYPPLPSNKVIPPDISNPYLLENYARYAYYFFVVFSGIVALVVLVIAGFRYFTSFGNPEAIKRAREQILSALLGLAIILSSWLIIYSINPDFVKFKMPLAIPSPAEIPPGVYLCTEPVNMKELWNKQRSFKQQTDQYRESPNFNNEEILSLINQIKEFNKQVYEALTLKCIHLTGSTDLLPPYRGNIKEINLIPAKVDENKYREYGVIVFDRAEREKFNEKTKGSVVYSSSSFGSEPEAVSVNVSSMITIASAKPFVFYDDLAPDAAATIYELPDLNKEDPSKRKQDLEMHGLNRAAGFYYQSINLEPTGSIDMKGNIFVIFFKEGFSVFSPNQLNNPVELDVVNKTDETLYDNPMGGWCQKQIKGENPQTQRGQKTEPTYSTLFGESGDLVNVETGYTLYYPCPKGAAVVLGAIY